MEATLAVLGDGGRYPTEIVCVAGGSELLSSVAPRSLPLAHGNSECETLLTVG